MVNDHRRLAERVRDWLRSEQNLDTWSTIGREKLLASRSAYACSAIRDAARAAKCARCNFCSGASPATPSGSTCLYAVASFYLAFLNRRMIFRSGWALHVLEMSVT